MGVKLVSEKFYDLPRDRDRRPDDCQVPSVEDRKALHEEGGPRKESAWLGDELIDVPAAFDLVDHLRRMQKFSRETFGPGARHTGIVDHIRKELKEIEQDPSDIFEWIDVMILALDGAWRAGYLPEEVAAALARKQEINEQRVWPDWRTADPDRAICHVV